MISRIDGDFLVLETLCESFPRVLAMVQYMDQKEITFMVPVLLDKALSEVMEEMEERKMTNGDKFPVTFDPKSDKQYPRGDCYRVRLVHSVLVEVDFVGKDEYEHNS